MKRDIDHACRAEMEKHIQLSRALFGDRFANIKYFIAGFEYAHNRCVCTVNLNLDKSAEDFAKTHEPGK